MKAEDASQSIISEEKKQTPIKVRNLIRGSHLIAQDQGALSLVRKFDRYHAYLILEYLDKDNERVTNQAHLVLDEEKQNENLAKVIYKKVTQLKLIKLSVKASKEKLYSVTWVVNVEMMRNFHDIVTDEVRRASEGKIKYAEYGKATTAGSVGKSLHDSKMHACAEWSEIYSKGSVSNYLLQNGHNCYSWAQAVAMSLGVKVPRSWMEFFVKDPTRVLHAKTKSERIPSGEGPAPIDKTDSESEEDNTSDAVPTIGGPSPD